MHGLYHPKKVQKLTTFAKGPEISLKKYPEISSVLNGQKKPFFLPSLKVKKFGVFEKVNYRRNLILFSSSLGQGL